MSRAEATRERILRSTALALTAEPGRPITMAAIAAASGVTRQLLYVHFDSKAALLVELSRVLDAEARTPDLQATIDNAPTGREALRAAVHVQAAIKPQIHALATSLELLRVEDEAAEAACVEREDARLERCRAVVARLASDGVLAPGWTPRTASEHLWAATSLRTWEDLVHRRGWTSRQWAERTTLALESALLASGPRSVDPPLIGGAP